MPLALLVIARLKVRTPACWQKQQYFGNSCVEGIIVSRVKRSLGPVGLPILVGWREDAFGVPAAEGQVRNAWPATAAGNPVGNWRSFKAKEGIAKGRIWRLCCHR